MDGSTGVTGVGLSFRAGMVELWGRGIERIMISCKTAGIDEPVFRYDSPGFWVEFLFAKVLPENKNSDGLGDGLGDSPKEKIITLIKKDDRISITEMSRILKISTTAIEKSLKRMKQNGLIQRVGSPKNGHWEILR